jgi:hypothetical protein
MKTILKLIACWAAFAAAFVVLGIVTRALHLQSISLPGNTPFRIQILAQAGAGALLVLGLYPLARQLAAPWAVRSLAMGDFLFLALGVNGTIEARKFTHFLDGGIAPAIVSYVILSLLVGTALGWFFGAPEPPVGLPDRGFIAWSSRGVAAWLAWPLIYFIFGACIAPIVVPYYNAGIVGLHIPPLSTILEVQLLRSLIFLAASLPFIALWKGSRRSLWFALGLTHAVVVGLYGLVGATFLPWVLRIAHGIEITCDGFAYAGLLVLLFAVPAAATQRPPMGETTQLKPCPSK